MLDLEVETAPTVSGINIVTLAEMKKHLRILHSKLDDVITDAVNDAADKLHGITGELNRTIFPTTWKRYLWQFPGLDACGRPLPIQLPYPPAIELLAITIEDGSSPANEVSPSLYVVKKAMIVPEIHPVSSWPYVARAPRAVSVTYRAGYETYPPKLKRMIKFLAAHYLENAEATINEPRQMMINRRVDFAMDDLRAALQVPLAYDDWNE